jgi:hypothetical protein
MDETDSRICNEGMETSSEKLSYTMPLFTKFRVVNLDEGVLVFFQHDAGQTICRVCASIDIDSIRAHIGL